MLEYFQRLGTTYKYQVLLGKPVPLGDSDDMVHIPPASDRVYARELQDCNPFHASTLVASYTNLSGPITHGMVLPGDENLSIYFT